jgi:hypothetical protein
MELLSTNIIRNTERDAMAEQDETMKMSGGAWELLNKAVTVVIHYLLATAHEFDMSKGTSTLGCTEIVEALNHIGITSLADDTKDFLSGFSFYYLDSFFVLTLFLRGPAKTEAEEPDSIPFVPSKSLLLHSFTLFSFISSCITPLFSRRRNLNSPFAYNGTLT